MTAIDMTILNFQVLKFIASLAICLCCMGCSTQMSDPAKPHHTKSGFRNATVLETATLLDFLKWRWGRIWKQVPAREAYHFQLARNDPHFLKVNRDKTTLTWIGHATVLLQMDGKNILTDPHFSRRASPVQWAGPERVVPPGLAFDDLPPIDIVVISHDHYDSLDETTVLGLHGREGGRKTHFFVPLGLKQWFHGMGIENVTELDWWDEYTEDQMQIVAVPVQHWSKRGLFARNKTLWAGWVIRSDQFRFFFAGDSGYSPDFAEIGRRLGPFDLSAIPIGAYEPRWFMQRHHMSPEEAVQVHMDARSVKSVAIHWGTFILTDEPLDEPPVRLKKAMVENGLSTEEFLILKHGETIVLE
jgi:N-acyl-phosphatidylethanolamine-hydrolysing phospholipase D